MQHILLKSVINLLILLIALIFVGCSTTIADLKSNSENMMIWRVNTPIKRTFRIYKDYAQNEAGSGLFGTGVRIDGYFYGESAELSETVTGGTNIALWHFELQRDGAHTLAKIWFKNNRWKRQVENKFKPLLPVDVIRLN